MTNVLGIDLGGTGFKGGRVQDGKIVEQLRFPVQRSLDEAQLLSILYRLIDNLIMEDTTAIGMGVPGVVDPDKGVLFDIQNLPAWQKVSIKQLIEEKYAIPLHINNDANCFALAEHRFGVGKGYQNMVGLSIGTGLGMGVVIHGQLYNGLLCGAGEIGMLKYLDGILEDYCGSFFFSTHYQSDGKTLYQQAQNGDPKALEAFQAFGTHMGEALKALAYLYAPQAVVLGGSIAQAYDYFKASMESTLGQFAYPKQIAQMRIVRSELKDSAILGAAALCI